MKRLVFLCFMLLTVNANTAGLEEGKVYRLGKAAKVDVAASNPVVTDDVAMGSQFKVVDTSDSNHYVVKFVTPRSTHGVTSTVEKGVEYILPRKINGVGIEKSSEKSSQGFVSGPLIVPFKYRLDDDSLGGDATVGYYAGYAIDTQFFGSDVYIPITPFLSGGFAQVSVEENGETDNKSAVTIAVGILLQNWAGLNIGFVVGQDRIGDGDWEHEGEEWVSFMVGYEL